MDNYNASTYGERCAEIYDDWYPTYDEAAITLLAELAGADPALELGIGTGRIALPLASRGVKVHGVDASPAMVSRLRARPGGDAIPVSMGDFADLPVKGEFSLVYVVFNTFFGILSQEDQVRCFRNVAQHLCAGGAFLLELFFPDLTRFTGNQSIRASQVTSDHLNLDIARHDPVHQQVVGHQVVIDQNSIRLYPVQLRYAWPSELDLMAQLAGLRLRHRWGGWRHEPFTPQSQKHISIYERAV